MGSDLRISGQPRLPSGVHVDPCDQTAFLDQHYLRAFVRQGGAKLKFVLGRTGSGKTHFLGALLDSAESAGFQTVYVDGSATPLWGADNLYRAIATDLDLDSLARRFGQQLAAEGGYEGVDLPPGTNLAGWAEAHGHDAARVRARLDELAYRKLDGNHDLHYPFALGLARWVEQVLWGAAPEADAAGGLLEYWLRGGKVAARDCNRLKLRRPVDRYTGMQWLRSLLHFVRIAGGAGLAVGIDNLGVLLEQPRRSQSGTGEPSAWEGFVASAPPALRYTKQRREDFYESLRTLIDEMGLVPGLLLLLAGPPELLSDDRLGIPAYNALQLRIQNEVTSQDVNRFADIIDLDRLWQAAPDAVARLVEHLVSDLSPGAPEPVHAEAVAAARAEWEARDMTISPVRRSVQRVLELAQTKPS